MKHENLDDVLWPRESNIKDVLINSIWGLIAWLIWSIIILIIVTMISGVLDVQWSFEKARMGISTSWIFPFLLSVVAFLASSVMIFSTLMFLSYLDPIKYKKNVIIYGQIAFFLFITYLFITPLYIYTGVKSYDNIMYVFLAHMMILSFGISVLLELLNNYRYVLPGLYSSFISLFLSSFIILSIFFSFDTGDARLFSLLIILPLINTFIIFFKQLFELVYYYYYKLTGMDQLGDIFYQIELEEKEQIRQIEWMDID